MLEARGVSVSLGGREVVSEVSLAIRPGEVLALAGPNGAGKSTLLACLSGSVEPTRGAALIDGASARALPPAELALRRAVLEQNPTALADFRLRELIALSVPREIAPDAAARIVEEALAALGLAGLARRRIGALSGGERHRGHMARVLAQLEAGRRLGAGRWLLLDEPTASLDLAHQASVLRSARRAAAGGAGVFAVLHDLTLAAHLADRIALMRDGRIAAVGPPAEVLTPARLEAVYDLPVLVSEPAPGALAVTPMFSR